MPCKVKRICFLFAASKQKSAENTAINFVFPLTKPPPLWYHNFRLMERYRSGYNGTVLKTVVSQGTVGSNPTLSAKCELSKAKSFVFQYFFRNGFEPARVSAFRKQSGGLFLAESGEVGNDEPKVCEASRRSNPTLSAK